MTTNLGFRFVHLTHLCAVVEAGSINRAANQLGLTQPALTRSISRLEETLNLQLLIRTSKGVKPTPFAQVLVDHVRKANVELQRAEDKIRELTGEVETTIVCGVGLAATSLLLPMAIEFFRKVRPKVHIRLIEDHTIVLLEALRQGAVDLVIGLKTDDMDAPDLEVDVLFNEKVEIYAGLNTPIDANVSHDFGEIMAKYKWIFPGSPAYMSRIIQHEFDAHKLSMPESYIDSRSVPIAKWLLKSSDYMTISTSLIFFEEIRNKTVKIINGNWHFPEIQTALYRQSEVKASKAVDLLSRCIMRSAGLLV